MASNVEPCVCSQSQGKEAPNARVNFSLWASRVGSLIGVRMSTFFWAVSSTNSVAKGIIFVLPTDFYSRLK